jgi:hypothetical protein
MDESLGNMVSDIFEGMNDLQIMTKYNISWVSEWKQLFENLVILGIIEVKELEKRFPPIKIERVRGEPSDARVPARNLLYGKVDICEMSDPAHPVELKNISVDGFMVAPIDAKKGERREFVIKPLYLEDVAMFHLTGECRWADGNRAGFKIIDTMPSAMNELLKFIKLFTFESF